MDQRGGKEEAEQTDRDIDEEDPAPGVVVGDPSAQRGTDDRSNDHAHTVNGHGHALFGAGKALDQDGLRDRLQSAAASTLQHPEQHQQRQAGGHAAKKGADDEDEHAGHEKLLRPKSRENQPVSGRTIAFETR